MSRTSASALVVALVAVTNGVRAASRPITDIEGTCPFVDLVDPKDMRAEFDAVPNPHFLTPTEELDKSREATQGDESTAGYRKALAERSDFVDAALQAGKVVDSVNEFATLLSYLTAKRGEALEANMDVVARENRMA